MKKVRYLLFALLNLVFWLTLLPLKNQVKASGTTTPTPVITTVANTISIPLDPRFSTIPGIISILSNILFPLIGLVLFAMIIYGGVTKLTAAGDAEKEKKAMQILKNSIIGAVIIILAKVIVDTIGAFLNMPSL